MNLGKPRFRLIYGGDPRPLTKTASDIKPYLRKKSRGDRGPDRRLHFTPDDAGGWKTRGAQSARLRFMSATGHSNLLRIDDRSRYTASLPESYEITSEIADLLNRAQVGRPPDHRYRNDDNPGIGIEPERSTFGNFACGSLCRRTSRSLPGFHFHGGRCSADQFSSSEKLAACSGFNFWRTRTYNESL